MSVTFLMISGLVFERLFNASRNRSSTLMTVSIAPEFPIARTRPSKAPASLRTAPGRPCIFILEIRSTAPSIRGRNVSVNLASNLPSRRELMTTPICATNRLPNNSFIAVKFLSNPTSANLRSSAITSSCWNPALDKATDGLCDELAVFRI